VIGGCTAVGAMQRATRWGAYWGSTAKPCELIPTVCFGTGAGLLPGLLLYGTGIRVWRPAPPPMEPKRVTAGDGRPAGH
jgi:hypothetical protein